MMRLKSQIARLKSCDSGGPIVEFAMVLPLLLLFIAIIIEGGRITWIHQATAAGVRDASRMIARIAPSDLCTVGGVAGYDLMATGIVDDQLGGSSIMPWGTNLVDVSLTCFERAGTYRVNPTAVVEVRAEVEIEYIFGGVFDFFGLARRSLTAEIADQARIFGV